MFNKALEYNPFFLVIKSYMIFKMACISF